jgi:hypothetical protein
MTGNEPGASEIEDGPKLSTAVGTTTKNSPGTDDSRADSFRDIVAQLQMRCDVRGGYRRGIRSPH